MAIVIGNKTASNVNPGSSTQTLSHNMSTGADGTLLVAITMNRNRSFTNCKYGGQTMTLVKAHDFGSGFPQRQAIFLLQSPPTGVNNIVATYNNSVFNGTSIFAVSLTGAAGALSNGVNALSSTPHSRSFTIAADSIIYATGISNVNAVAYSIGGTTRTLEFNHNTNKKVGGGLSSTNLAAGAQNVTTKCSTGSTVTNLRIEIGAASSTPTTNTGNFLLCM